MATSRETKKFVDSAGVTKIYQTFKSDLQTAIGIIDEEKADVVHTHVMADITDFSGGGVGQEYKVEGVTKGEIFNDYTNNVASGIHSFAAGEGTIASATGAAAFGKFNISNSNNIFSVGIGTGTSARTDAFFIDTTGNGTISNNFTVGNNLTVSGNTVVTGSVTASAFILPSTPSNEVGAVWLV